MKRRNFIGTTFTAILASMLPWKHEVPVDEKFERVVVEKPDFMHWTSRWQSVDWEDIKKGDVIRRMSDPDTAWTVNENCGPGIPCLFVEPFTPDSVL